LRGFFKKITKRPGERRKIPKKVRSGLLSPLGTKSGKAKPTLGNPSFASLAVCKTAHAYALSKLEGSS